jgi:hypothetical protein
MKKLFIFLIFLLVLNFPLTVNCVGMNSENFKLFADVVSVGGSEPVSENYRVFNTEGEAAGIDPTKTTSTNYQVQAGFQAMANTIYISTAVSASSLSLGELNTTAVNSNSETITVNTNSPTGYTTTIVEDGNLRSGTDDINDVADGTVTIGSEEYGVRTSGVAGQMNSADTAITAVAQNVAASSTPVRNEITTLIYKAGISASTAYGNYSHQVTFTTTVNY